MSPRTKAPKGSPATWKGEGDIKVESTPDGVLLRLTFPDNDEAGVEVDGEAAVDIAATIMFCALRHFQDSDVAVEKFMQRMHARSMELALQTVRATRPS